MKKIAALALLCLLFHAFAFSQSNSLDKQMEKAKKMAKENKFDDADKFMTDLLRDNPSYGEGWDFLAKVLYREYQNSKQSDNLFGNKITVTTKDSDGKTVEKENDTLATKLMELLNNIQPSKKAYSKYIYTLRKATLLSEDAYQASSLLRSIFVDPDVDTNVSKKALKYYDDAEEEFEKENYNDAAKLYKRAIEEQPDFYKATMYLGDVYFFTDQYYEAASSFQKAVKMYPDLIEPRKYLVDTYTKQKRYEDAMQEAIDGMAVYPDVTMMQRLEDAVYLTNKKMDIKRTMRPVFPNKIESDSVESALNQYTDEDNMEAKGEWVFYQGAKEKIKEYCDANGKIVKPNSLTKSKYMEVFSWEEMLKNSDSPALEEAKKMESLGYLDCYVLVTCYHYDLYPQYADFISDNRQRIIDYYKKLIR